MSALEEAVEAAGRFEAALAGAAYARANAVGIFLDDPDDPHVAIAVHEGRIVHLTISDAMLRVGLDQLQDVLNAGIIIAFGQWRAQCAGRGT